MSAKIAFGLLNTHELRDMADEVINQLLLSRVIPDVSFNLTAYVEPGIPGRGGVQSISPNSRHLIKPKILEGLSYTKNCTPSPVTHSFTHSHSH